MVNVSSPNTPGLRDLQRKAALEDLLARVVEARERYSSGPSRPALLVKIAPDLGLRELDDLVALARRLRVDGLILTNTTVSRPERLEDRVTAREPGGLSGRPLFALSSRMLAETLCARRRALVDRGRRHRFLARRQWQKSGPGADLVQLYTGLIYRGFAVLDEIKTAVLAALQTAQLPGPAGLVGLDPAAHTREPWPRYQFRTAAAPVDEAPWPGG